MELNACGISVLQGESFRDRLHSNMNVVNTIELGTLNIVKLNLSQ